MSDIIVYKSDGSLFGFIRENNLYSKLGQYLGWKEANYIWDAQGQFRGNLTLIDTTGQYYILRFIFDLSPIPQSSRIMADLPPGSLPNMQLHISPIKLEFGYKDGF